MLSHVYYLEKVSLSILFINKWKIVGRGFRTQIKNRIFINMKVIYKQVWNLPTSKPLQCFKWFQNNNIKNVSIMNIPKRIDVL